jgi:thioredoxin-dependent adenylylsulfate APS reductase
MSGKRIPAEPLLPEEEKQIRAAVDRFEHATAEEILAWALDRFHPRIAISVAGGLDGMVVLDTAWRINREVRAFTLDTGRLPPETYTLFEEVRDRYGIDVEFVYPAQEEVQELVTRKGPNLMYRSVENRLACCEVRKVKPLQRKLATLDAWVTGLRRDQWRTRKNIAKVELDRDHGGVCKVNPVADWTQERIREYIRANNVPYHELFDRGYTSIGCAPCTRPVQPGEPERAGRWWWETEADKECGIHCSVQLLGSTPRPESDSAGPLGPEGDGFAGDGRGGADAGLREEVS